MVLDFDYVAPRSLEEAIAILAKANGSARPLAGGTDLIDQIRQGRKTPTTVVDVKGIPKLSRLDYSKAKGLYIGAAVSCMALQKFPPAVEHYPMLVYAASLVGSIQIQNRATIAGNLCNAAPSADTASALICFGARAIIAGSKGQREVPVEDLFVGPGQTTLAADELLLALVVPTPPANSVGSYLRFIPREEMDIAVAGVGSFLVMDGDRKRCQHARIALGAVAPTPIRAKEAESYLAGRVVDQTAMWEAGELAATAARPISDIRGSADYRRELIKVLTRRTLQACVASLTK